MNSEEAKRKRKFSKDHLVHNTGVDYEYLTVHVTIFDYMSR